MERFFPTVFPTSTRGANILTTGEKLQAESLPTNLFLKVLNPLLRSQDKASDTAGNKTIPECLSSLAGAAVDGETEDESGVFLSGEIGFPGITAVPWQGASSPLLVSQGSMFEDEVVSQSSLVLDEEGALKGELPARIAEVLKNVSGSAVLQETGLEKNSSVFSLDSEGKTGRQSGPEPGMGVLDGEGTLKEKLLAKMAGAPKHNSGIAVLQETGQGKNSSAFSSDSIFEGKAASQSSALPGMLVSDREGALQSSAQSGPSVENKTNGFTQIAGTSQEDLLSDARTALAKDTASGESWIGKAQDDPNALFLLKATADVQQSGGKNAIMTQGIEQVQQTEAELPAQKIISQIVEKAHLFLGKDESALRLQLKPELLGHLDLVVKVEKGLVHAHFIAENSAVAKMIQGHIPELRQSLEQQGVSWQQLSVSVDSQSGSTGFSSSGSGAESSADHGSPSYQGSFEGRLEEHQERTERPQLTGLVDYLI